MCMVLSARISPTPIESKSDFTIVTLRINVTNLFQEILTLENDIKDRISVLKGITVDKSPTYLCDKSDTVLEKVSSIKICILPSQKGQITKYSQCFFLIE